MSQFQQKVEVRGRELLAPDICRLTLNAPDIAAAARPGQFVMLRTTCGQDPLLRRPLSIHQTSDDGGVQIVLKVVGRGTDLLARLQSGDIVEILGPLGQGFRIKEHREHCLVGGGMGIAPLLFLAHWLLQKCKMEKEPIIILGARNRVEIEPFVADFQHTDLQVHIATDDGSLGHHGLVTDIVKRMYLQSEDMVYSCGPKPMMAALSLYCHAGQVPCQVSMETVMACGMGACLGCAVAVRAGGYAHVCSDGPVFDAQELVWTL